MWCLYFLRLRLENVCLQDDYFLCNTLQRYDFPDCCIDWASIYSTASVNKKRPAAIKLKVFDVTGRDGVIRTHDPLHPMQVRYQAALRPDERAIIAEACHLAICLLMTCMFSFRKIRMSVTLLMPVFLFASSCVFISGILPMLVLDQCQ